MCLEIQPLTLVGLDVVVGGRGGFPQNKLASLEATLVRNSAHPLTHSLIGVKCRATSVAKKLQNYKVQLKFYI